MSATRAVLEQPEGWQHMQKWFDRTDDPLRPWNVSAISRHLQLPIPVVRALLLGPKGSQGMIRTAFTITRLRMFQKMFRRYGYRVSIPEEVTAGGSCRIQKAPQGLLPAPYAYTGLINPVTHLS